MAKNQNSAEITPWRINSGQSWFGARIYPKALTLGYLPLNFRIKILKYILCLNFVKKKFSPIRPTVQKIIGDKLVTDRQQTHIQTDRHFWADPHPYGKLIFFFFFFCVWEGKNDWGEIYTSLLRLQGYKKNWKLQNR